MEETHGGAEGPFGAVPVRAAHLDLVLVYNATTEVHRGFPTDNLPDADEVSMAPVADALRQLGHRVRTLGITYETLHLLDTLCGDFVLNLCDGTGLDGNPGLEVVMALDRRGIPYSGVGPWCYAITNDKWATKARLAAARVPVPCGAVIPHGDVPLPSSLRYPMIVKPRDGFGSLGVDERSVVRGPRAARAAIGRIVDRYGSDALMEHYIEGREITVAVFGAGAKAYALPPLEVQFGPAYNGKPRIRMFATKFDTASPLYQGFQPVCPAPLDSTSARRVEQAALRAYRAVQGDGYARVDMRLSADGIPYVLEVNGNCSLEDADDPHDAAMLPLIARAVGWSYPELLGRLITIGLERPRSECRPLVAPRWQQGRAAIHAVLDLEPNDRVQPLGSIHWAPRSDPRRHTMLSTSGRALFVEPHVRHLTHSDNPNIRIVRDGTKLWLEVARPIRAGEELTLDRLRPLELAVAPRRPVAYGRRLPHGSVSRSRTSSTPLAVPLPLLSVQPQV